jgi:hypothetical protein
MSNISDNQMKLYVFLEKHHCLSAFIRAYNRCFNGDSYDFYEKEKPEEYLWCAFGWEETPEGHHFWENISILWRKELGSHTD